MRRLSLLALACLVGGVALLAYGAATGQGQVTLFVIFPVFTGTGVASVAGMLLLVAAMFLWFASLAGFPTGRAAEPSSPTSAAPPSSASPPASPPRKFGGVVFLGTGKVAPTLDAMGNEPSLPSVGAGVRWLAAEKARVNLSVDFARGKDESTVYVYVKEAF